MFSGLRQFHRRSFCESLAWFLSLRGLLGFGVRGFLGFGLCGFLGFENRAPPELVSYSFSHTWATAAGSLYLKRHRHPLTLLQHSKLQRTGFSSQFITLGSDRT